MDKKFARRSFAALAGAVAAVAVHTPASAQSMSKTEAILGGPSALELLKAQQSGIALPARPTLQPASLSYARPNVIPAIVGETPPVSPGVANGRPDIFGSVALRVGRTPLDSR